VYQYQEVEVEVSVDVVYWTTALDDEREVSGERMPTSEMAHCRDVVVGRKGVVVIVGARGVVVGAMTPLVVVVAVVSPGTTGVVTRAEETVEL
jgi:hypothetical protein